MSRSSQRVPATEAVELDEKAALARVLRLMAIPGKSREEGAIAKAIAQALTQAGVPATALAFDDAPRRIPGGGQCGNLICTLPGTLKAPRRLLMAHMDTVPLCVGCRPKRQGGLVRSANPATALGADDRAGVAVILTAVTEILRRKLPHPPLTLFFAVQEELGMLGVRHARASRLGRPGLCFNWDGGGAAQIDIGATGSYELQIEIGGLASHAGVHPEHGINALTSAALALADLQRDGWLGLVRKGRHAGTSNIGTLDCSGPTNVVPARVRLCAEVRSHDPAFRKRMVKRFRQAFLEAVCKVTNHRGRHGTLSFQAQLKYESFVLKRDEPCLEAARRALRAEGLQPEEVLVNGGLDANWMGCHGLPTVTLGCGQTGPHTLAETLRLDEYLKACRVALRIACGS